MLTSSWFHPLFKVLAREFYRINATFFLLVTGICFGFLSGKEHKALGDYFVSSVSTTLIPILLWSVYSVKVILFNQKETGLPKNQFIHLIALVDTHVKIALYTFIAVTQLIPILAYGVFLLMLSSSGVTPEVPMVLVASLVILIATVTFSLHHSLSFPLQQSSITFLKKYLDSRFVKPYFLFFIEWISRRQMGLLFSIKAFSCVLTYAIAQLYERDYDVRLMAFGCIIAAGGNLVLVFHYHRFENFHLQLLRGLPFTLTKRLNIFLCTFFILILPEWSMLAGQLPAPLNALDFLSMMSLLFSILLVGYSSLFIQDITLDQFSRRIFIATITLLILTLLEVPVPLMTLLFLLMGLLLFRRHFYSFEFIAELDTEK